MSQLPMNVLDRNVRAYNREERALIDVYKEDYITSSTPNNRAAIVNTKMFPALKTHWDKNGINYDPVKAKMKGVPKSSKVLKVRKSDVVARTMKDAVEAEIDALLDPEDSNKIQKRFSVRNLAVSNIIKRMTSTELKNLEEKADKMSEEGYPQEICRQLAEKHSETRLKASAKAHWLELGFLSVTFAAFEDSTGRVVAEIHDDIAELLGVQKSMKIKSFEETYPKQAHEIQRLMIEYVRNVIDKSQGREMIAAQENTLGSSDDGFPIIGPSWNKEKLGKADASKLYREYLSKHYKLATNGRTEQVPYGDIMMDVSKFIHKDYLPLGFVFKDPHNTGIDDIKAFFDHIYDREQNVQPAEVFRFHSITTSRINGTVVPACYGNGPENHEDVPAPLNKRQRRKNKKSAQQKPDSVNTVNTNNADVLPRPNSDGEINAETLAHPELPGKSNAETTHPGVYRKESVGVPVRLHNHGEGNADTPNRLHNHGEGNADTPNGLVSNGGSNANRGLQLNVDGEIVEYHPKLSRHNVLGRIDPLQVDDEVMFQYLCDIGAFSFPPLENVTVPVASSSSGQSSTTNAMPQLSFTEMLMEDYHVPGGNLFDISETPSMARNTIGNSKSITNGPAPVGMSLELPSMVNNEWSYTGMMNENAKNDTAIRVSNDAAKAYMDTIPQASAVQSRVPSPKPLVWRQVNMNPTLAPTYSDEEMITGTTIQLKTANTPTIIKAAGELNDASQETHGLNEHSASKQPRVRTARNKRVVSDSSPAQILNRVLTDMPMTPTKATSQPPKSNAVASKKPVETSHNLNGLEQPAKGVVNQSKRKANTAVDESGNAQNGRTAKKVMTSDVLAMHEADSMKVKGKRVPKKRIRE
uniref:Uncharacterized protein n=1 Tax=Psilocybe cubensis TaxID=181762 RepID=A0A8H8CGH6_PSICU